MAHFCHARVGCSSKQNATGAAASAAAAEPSQHLVAVGPTDDLSSTHGLTETAHLAVLARHQRMALQERSRANHEARRAKEALRAADDAEARAVAAEDERDQIKAGRDEAVAAARKHAEEAAAEEASNAKVCNVVGYAPSPAGGRGV